MKTRIITLVIAMLGLAISSPAVFGNGSEVADEQKPVLIEGAMPLYPLIARELNIEGIVRIECLVDEHGRVLGAEVVQSLNRDLDNAVLEAAKTWKFKPATRDGKPIAAIVRMPVRFEMKHASGVPEVETEKSITGRS